MKYVDRLLVVERDRFRLTLFDLPGEKGAAYDELMQFPVAIGADGFNTPGRRLYRVTSKARDPEWQMPQSSWVPKEMWGTIVPGGSIDPYNPIRERWIGIDDANGIGIHGTDDDDSIGKAASHGCVRMRVPDICDLYPEVPLSTPCYIV